MAMATFNSKDTEKTTFKVTETTSPDRSWLSPSSAVRPKVNQEPFSIKPLFSDDKTSPPPYSAAKTSPLFSAKSFSIQEITEKTPRTRWNKLGAKLEELATWILCPELFRLGIFMTAIYSTALSIVWFLIAIIRPHWGNLISNNGSLSPTVASVLIAGFAKSIEMSFVTVMIACLGQYLTHKAKDSGISVTDLQLRTMILLPCSLVSQKGGFRTLWRSGFLGFLCILGYISATFYTTASDAVVSPRLSVTTPTTTNLSAFLQTSIANTFHIGQSCPNPPSSVQNLNTCITTEHAGLSFRNYLMYLANWQTLSSRGQRFTELTKPLPSASFSDSVAVQGRWLHPVNYTQLSKQNGRLITGSTMAMPYAGVVNATTIPENWLNIGNQGAGELSVNAKAVTPVVGVTCAVVTPQELVPIVYMNWSHPVTGPISPSEFDNTYKNETWRTNVTAFDKLFQFDDQNRHRPVFYKLPEPYNTEIDSEGTYRDMLYILLNSNTSKTAIGNDQQYTLCGMNFTLMGGCSSVYTANTTGTKLELNCDKGNDMAFPPEKVAVLTSPKDWVNVAAVWGRSISLGTGITDGRAASAAILTQLAATDSTFDTREPSLPDSLALLSAGTLLQSTVDTPFDGFWPFNVSVGGPNNLLPRAVLQRFEAKIQVPDYSSGITNDWKNIFVSVLLIVVLMNVGCLAYLTYLTIGRLSISRKVGIRRIPPHKIQDDVTELREVFTSAISSPAVYIIDTPDTGQAIQWRYHNGVFRPSNYGNRAKVNVQWFQQPDTKRKVNGWL